MAGFTPIDQQTRDEIRSALDRNFFVEAGAGTGKTTVLVDRIVEIFRSGHAGIDEVAVITFTEKAAAELESRIREKLEGALAQSDEPAERERIEEALRGLPRARIETIHAFAASLLRERPVEAGLDPGFDVLDDLGADLSFDEAYREWLGAHLRGNPPALWRALNRGMTLAQIREVTTYVHQYRDLLPLRPFPAEAPDVAGFVARLDRDVAELEALLRECRDLDDNGAREIERVKRLRDDCLAARDDPDTLERCILHAGKIKAKGAAKNWQSKAAHERQKEICTGIGEDLLALQEALKSDALTGLLPLAEEFVRGYETKRRDAGKAEFDDLLIWARNLLRDNLDVRRYFQRRYRCVLVDEFQDTDPLQVEIVLYLSADGDQAGDWRSLRPADGALFVVGDPKQSIYRFRRADITIYEWVKRAVMGGEFRAISQNFRSLNRLIQWINTVFSRIIAPEDGIQAAYIPLDPLPPRMNLPRSPVVVLYGDGEARGADEVRQREAEALAHVIREAIEGAAPWPVRDPESGEERPARWRDVAILIPSRTGIEHYEDALAAAGIPYRHEGGRAFFQRQEVREFIACLRAIDDPGDGVSLVAALRSGAFGCSDEEIFRYAAEAGGLDYRQRPLPGHPAVAEAMEALHALHDLRRSLTLPQAVRRVLDETGLLAFALTLPQGDQAAANLLKVADQARAFAAAHGGGLRAFVRWLAATSTTRGDEADAAVAESGDDVVRILTIHGAKGLEFPIVALANLNGRQANAPSAIPDRDGHRLHLRIGSQGAYFQTPGFTEAAEIEKQHADAERARLLYVAATRARDHLIIPVVPAKLDGMLARLAEHLPDPAQATLGTDVDGCHLYNGLPPVPLARAEATKVPAATPDAVEAGLRAREAWLAARADLIATAGRGLGATTASSVEDWDWRAEVAGEETERREARSVALAIGVAFHDAMETVSLPDAADLEAVARARAAEAGIPGAAPEIIEMARRCLASPSLARAIRSGRYYRETVYSLSLPDGGLVEGRMDLLFQEADGLVIVDYKTDRVTAGEVEERLHAYRNQAAVYAYATARISDRPVKEVVFVFARPGIERAVPVDADLLALGERLADVGGVFGQEPNTAMVGATNESRLRGQAG